MNGDARSARTSAISDQDEDNALLYTLDFESPFPWPAVPSYPIGRHSAADHSNSRIEGDVDDAAQDAPAASTSNLGVDAMLDSNGDTHDIIDAGDALSGQESIHYPDTMQEYYWDCLYCSSKKSKNEPATRLIQAFKPDRYKTTTLHSDGTQEIHQSYRDTLSSILYTKLGKLDKKYHVDLPLIIDDWSRTHEYLENGTLAETEEEEHEIQNGGDTMDNGIVSADKLEKVRAEYEEKELEILKMAWQGWMASARDNEGERVVSTIERRNRLRSTVRERLNALETSELQLQILLALELLCVLPMPSYLTSRNAHHRRLHSSSSSIPQNWLAILRAGTPQRGSNASRKRKKDQSAARDSSSSFHSGPVTSSNLTTPRQSSTPFNPTSFAHIESIPEDEQDEEAITRTKLEKLFKETARLLDSQTDNLAIQQTVANAIGGLSLTDLMGDAIHSSLNEDEKGKGKEKEELDGFQSFWLDVVEEHYSTTRLPSDILSGCHSKLFSNSLDPSLLHSSNSNMATLSNSHPHPSPFHHPTPDLKQLARSVHLANIQAEKMAIPQSPTLVKLLAAKEEPKSVLSYLEGDDDGGGGIIGDDVNWLMPAPAPISLGAGSTLSTNNGDKLPCVKKSIKTLSRASSGSFTSSTTLRNNQDMRRIVEFGKVKIIKEKREEIQKNMSSKNNTFKPFNSTASLVNAHLQSQLQNGLNGDNHPNGRMSAMASSIGARNLKNTTSSSMIEEGDTMDRTSRDGGTGSLSSSTIGQPNTANNGRISKRKAASPKKTTLVFDKSGNHKGRTLVLATPVKVRSTKSTSTSSLFGLDNHDHQRDLSFKQESNHRDNNSKNHAFVKSVSLPAFKWGHPAMGRGIDEADEEEMDRGLAGGSDGSDDGEDEEGNTGRGRLKGLLLVGETPQKG